MSNAQISVIVCEGVSRACPDAESSEIITPCAPCRAVLYTLAGIILPEGAIRTPEHTSPGHVLSIGPWQRGAHFHTGFGAIISIGARDNNGFVRADRNTTVGDIISIGVQVNRAVPYTPASVVIGVHGRTILHTFPRHVAVPKVRRAVEHTGIGQIVCEHVRICWACPHTLVGSVISIFAELAIAVRHTSSFGVVCILVQGAITCALS